MVFHHPVVFLADERLQQGGAHVGVVVGAQGVADVVQQGAHHVLLVLAVAVGQGGGLQAVGEAVHREAAAIAFQQLQVGDDAIGQFLGETAEGLADDLPILGGALFHMLELSARLVVMTVHTSLLGWGLNALAFIGCMMGSLGRAPD